MSEFTVEPAELREYAQYMRTLSDGFNAIKSFTTGEGCDIRGFIGLLGVLAPAVQGLGMIISEVLDVGLDRMTGSAEGLDTTAADYEATDRREAANQNAIRMPATPDPVRGA